MTSFSMGVVYFTFIFLFIYLYVCVCMCLCVDIHYIHNWANLFPHHIPVNKLKQSPHRCEAMVTGSTNKLTTKKCHSFFFLWFLLLQRKRKPSLGAVSDKLYIIKTPQNLDPGKRRERDAAAMPHQDRRDISYSEATWSQDTCGHFSGICLHQRWRGVNICVILWATISVWPPET